LELDEWTKREEKTREDCGLLLRPVRADDDVLVILSVGLHKEILMATCLSLSSTLIAKILTPFFLTLLRPSYT
jgi:hypothetical protein